MRRGAAKAKKSKTENDKDSALEGESTAENQGNGDTNVSASGGESDKEDKKTISQKRKGKRGKKEDSSQKDESGDAENAEPSEKKAKRGTRNVKNATEGTAEEQGEEYEVEKIVDMKENRGKRHFRIHWKGYGPESETWEKEEDLSCPDLIKEYLSQLPNKAKKRKAKSANSKTTRKKLRVSFSANNKEYEVAQVMQMNNKKNGKREFLVHWKGFSHAEDTWEPEENLNCPDLIEEFMKKTKVTNEKPDRKNAARGASSERGRRAGRRSNNKLRAAHNSE